MKALITGICGQDGSYLAELLLSRGYEVFGTSRRVAVDQHQRYYRINHILNDIHIISASVENYASIFNAIQQVQPDEIYHLAAQSFVADSFADEFTTMATNNIGTHNILSIIKTYLPNCRFYFAGSSEMFGDVLESPQTERTPFNPRSVYGISKCCGFYLTKYYRDTYGLHASSGMLFNHESPRRGAEFVTQKIVRYTVKIKKGLEKKLPLGNIGAKRDWGHSKDYVEAMYLMLQQPMPDDYVIATGKTYSVHDFCREAFDCLSLDCDDYIEIDEQFFRPSDVNLLIGDASKAEAKLKWKPKINFKELVREMIEVEVAKND